MNESTPSLTAWKRHESFHRLVLGPAYLDIWTTARGRWVAGLLVDEWDIRLDLRGVPDLDGAKIAALVEALPCLEHHASCVGDSLVALREVMP